jgi:hypothetical protein
MARPLNQFRLPAIGFADHAALAHETIASHNIGMKVSAGLVIAKSAI